MPMQHGCISVALDAPALRQHCTVRPGNTVASEAGEPWGMNGQYLLGRARQAELGKSGRL